MNCIAAVGIQCVGCQALSKSNSDWRTVTALIQSFQDASTRVLCTKLDTHNFNKCTLFSQDNGKPCIFVVTSLKREL